MPWSALAVYTGQAASPQVPLSLPHVLSLSLPVLSLSLRARSLSLLSVTGFTDNSDNNGSEYAGLPARDGALGCSSGPERRLVVSVRRKRPPSGRAVACVKTLQ